MVAKGRKTKKNGSKARMGRLMSPVDVRSADKIGAFENMLGKGPLTLVLVYADWCGHCHRFKKDTWKDLTAMSNRKMNIASVRDDMLSQTSLSNSKLKGYPSLMLVGSDKRPAEFNEDNEVTNALPSNEKKNLQSLLQTPLPNVNASLSTKMVTPVKTVSAPMEPSESVTSLPPSPAANLSGSLKPPSQTMVASQDEVDEELLNTPISATMPPDTNEDIAQEPLEPTPSKKAVPVGGGNLLNSLIRLAKSGTKAFMKKRRTVKRKAGRKSKGTKKGK